MKSFLRFQGSSACGGVTSSAATCGGRRPSLFPPPLRFGGPGAPPPTAAEVNTGLPQSPSKRLHDPYITWLWLFSANNIMLSLVSQSTKAILLHLYLVLKNLVLRARSETVGSAGNNLTGMME
jgi:hypothetical protein